MDEADRDIDMAADPFLEAGIDIPKELPYKERKRKSSLTASAATLKMKISRRPNNESSVAVAMPACSGGDHITASAAAVKAASNSTRAISKLQHFTKRFGSRQYQQPPLHGIGRGRRSSGGGHRLLGGSVPTEIVRGCVPAAEYRTTEPMEAIPGSNEGPDLFPFEAASACPRDDEEAAYFNAAAFLTEDQDIQ